VRQEAVIAIEVEAGVHVNALMEAVARSRNKSFCGQHRIFVDRKNLFCLICM
jgi:hypothetical protein